MAKFAVILPAAGQSRRFGGPRKKPFVELADKPIWLHSADLFATRPDVCRVIIVISPDDLDDFKNKYAAQLMFREMRAVAGGAERHDSVAAGLSAVPDEADFVAVHDAARPLTSAALISAVFAQAHKTGAAIAAVPVTDTLKRVGKDHVIERTEVRDGLWQAQTPQAFRRDWLTEAYAQRRGDITDDAQLVESLGHPVQVVVGEPTNLKITTKADLAIAEALLAGRKRTEKPRSLHPFADEEGW